MSGAGTSWRGPTFMATWRIQPRQDAFLFSIAEIVRIADNAALSAAEGNVHHGAFPGHPHGESADGVHGFMRMEPDPALVRAAGVVVLNAESPENLGASVVHADGNQEMILAQGIAEQIAGRLIQAEFPGNGVELLLSHLKRIERFFLH